MNRKILLLPAAVALLLSVAVASSAGTSHAAQPVVRILEARYHNAKTLKAVFLERYSDSRQDMEVQSGTVYFARPGRMRWEYESPQRKLFISDGKTVWFYVPSDHTVTRSPIRKSTDWRTPLALLTGNTKLSRLCGQIDLVNQAHIAPGHAVLRCIPHGQEKQARAASRAAEEGIAGPEHPFDRVFLEVDRATGTLYDVRIDQPGGIELEFRFGDWEENLPVKDSLFTFRPPVGVAIVDGSKSSAEP